MNVNEKGNVGLIEAIRDLTKKGYECFTPFHDYSAVDLIALCNNYRPIKLQVKYRTEFRGAIEVHFRSMVNGAAKDINFDAIDGWAVYCPEIDRVVYVGKHEVDVTKGSFTFRLTEGANRVNINKVKRKLYTDFGDVAEWPKAAGC
jgi:hypothetical protein